MINTRPLGNYQTAMNYALAAFRRKDPRLMAELSGTSFDADQGSFTLPSLGQRLSITYPEGIVSFAGTDYKPLWSWAFFAINYLSRADGTKLTGRLISYKELDNGHVFFPTFYKRSIFKLAQSLGSQPLPQIKTALGVLAGQLLPEADISATLRVFPRFPVTIKLWLADEEMEASANLLFDACANHYLHTEDIAEVGSLITYLLIQCLQPTSRTLAE